MINLKKIRVESFIIFIALIFLIISAIFFMINEVKKSELMVEASYIMLITGLIISHRKEVLKTAKSVRLILAGIKTTTLKFTFRKNLDLVIIILLALIYGTLGFFAALDFNEYVSDEVWYVPSARNIFKRILGYEIGSYPYPEKENIRFYLNIEHPPLAKYIIGLAIVFLGDKPWFWRLPGIMEASIILVLVYLCAKKISNSIITAFISSILIFLDPLISNMRIVAMLDIHQAFFIMLAFTFMLYDKPKLSALMIGFAGSVKYSGFFVIPALLLHMILSKKRIMEIIEAVFIIPILTFVIVNFPFIIHFGLYKWISDQIWAYRWHTSFKENPFISPPWGWLFNIQPFVLKYDAEGKPLLVAKTNPYLYPLIIPATVLFFILRFKDKLKKTILPYIWFWSYYLMYFVLYALGGTSQEIFYATSLSPFLAIALPSTFLKAIDIYFSKSEGETAKARYDNERITTVGN